MTNEKYILNSVDNTLRLIELLMDNEEMGVAEISRAMNLGKATVFRMLATLENREFVKKTDNAKYSLGIKFALIGNLVLGRQNLIETIRPYMKELRDLHRETVHLSILGEDYKVVVLEKVVSNSTIQMGSRIGYKMPAYAMATGKALLAWMDFEKREEYLNNVEFVGYNKNTIVDRDELSRELDKIRFNGYAEDLEESEIGLVCYGAPIMDLDGNAIAAISISGPSVRMMQNKEEIVKSVVEMAMRISRDFGYRE